MLTRRNLLRGCAALGATGLLHPLTDALAKAAQPGTSVNFDVPAHSCDCHVHVFDPQRFPFAASRTYTPESASAAELRALHRTLRLERTIIVQPSVYGTDNSCMLDALKQLGSPARGIAVIDERTDKASLDQMERAGVRGVRINLGTSGQNDPEIARRRLGTTIDQIKDRNWHIQIYTKPDVIAAVSDQLKTAPMPIVLDHFAGGQASLGVQQPGFGDILSLVSSGNIYVKISAAYRVSNRASDYSDVASLAQALVRANPRRILWGSDWPHPNTVPGAAATDISPLLAIDDGRVFNLLATWVPEPTLRKTILVDNPAQLYGF